MTTIHVQEATWKILKSIKKPDESMDDVINRLIESYRRLTMVEGNITSEKTKEDLDTLLEEFCAVSTDELQKIIEASRKSFSLLGGSYEKGSA